MKPKDITLGPYLPISHITNIHNIHITYNIQRNVCITLINVGCWIIVIAFSYDEMYPTKKEVWPYIISRILLGVAAPLILVLSLIPLATILRFITNGKVELNQFLPVLSEGTIQYKTHKDIAYWVVQDLFYFPIGIPAKQINSWKSALKQGKNLTLDDITIQNVKAISPSNPQWWTHWYHAFDWSPATWLLYMTQCLILVIMLTYVVNSSFITQITYESCRELTTFELYNYNCFTSQWCFQTLKARTSLQVISGEGITRIMHGLHGILLPLLF